MGRRGCYTIAEEAGREVVAGQGLESVRWRGLIGRWVDKGWRKRDKRSKVKAAKRKARGQDVGGRGQD